MKDELDLLPIVKHQRFLQIAIIILGLCGQAWHANKHKIQFDSILFFLFLFFYNLIVSLWSCIAKHAQSTQIPQNIKFAMSLQYLK